MLILPVLILNIADVISLYTTSSRYTIAGFIRDNIIAVLKKSTGGIFSVSDRKN